MVIINIIKNITEQFILLCPCMIFVYWVYVLLRTLPQQLTYGLHDNILNCFFPNTDSSLEVSFMTDILSPSIYDGSDMIISIILSLYLKPLKASMPCFMATNKAPKTHVSTLACFFENHCIKVVFTYIKKPCLDLKII